MTAKIYNLDDLRKRVEEKYPPTIVGGYTILHPLRLDEEQRKATLAASQRFADADPDEAFDYMREVLRIAVADGEGDALIAEIGDDLALAAEVMAIWTANNGVDEPDEAPAPGNNVVAIKGRTDGATVGRSPIQPKGAS